MRGHSTSASALQPRIAFAANLCAHKTRSAEGPQKYAHELELERLSANKYSLNTRQRQPQEPRGENSQESQARMGKVLKTPGLTTLFQIEKLELDGERARLTGTNKQIPQKKSKRGRKNKGKKENSPTGLADNVNKHHSYCSLTICQVLYCF